MNSRDANQHKYHNAGEQVGRVISEFMSIADDLSKRFEKEFSSKDNSCQSNDFKPGHERGDPPNDGASHSECGPHSSSNSSVGNESSHNGFNGAHDAIDLENEWRNAGEYLRELREAAGYTVDGFAKAMNRQGAARKIQSVEEGQDLFPEDWLDQISALLKQNDPLDFVTRLRGLYDTEPQTDSEVNGHTAEPSPAQSNVAGVSVAEQRRQKLQNIFSDEQLEGLSDRQFEELLSFAEINFQSALQLVKK